MAPKNKGKKGKKQDDDDFWCEAKRLPASCCRANGSHSYREKAGTSVAGNNVVSVDEQSEDDQSKTRSQGGFSAFADLGVEGVGAEDEDDEDFGGLMVRKVLYLASALNSSRTLSQ